MKQKAETVKRTVKALQLKNSVSAPGSKTVEVVSKVYTNMSVLRFTDRVIRRVEYYLIERFCEEFG
jgi:type II secretory pathway component HofQ